MRYVKILIPALALLLAGGLIYYNTQIAGAYRVRIVLTEDSTSREDLSLIINEKNRSYKIPGTIRLGDGEYSYLAWGPGTIPVTGTFSVSGGAVVPLTMMLGVGQEEMGFEAPVPQDGIVLVHETNDFKIESRREGGTVVELLITPYHRFTTRDDPESFQLERRAILRSADGWLEGRFDRSIKKTIIEP